MKKILILLLLLPLPLLANEDVKPYDVRSLWLQDLTWIEVKDALKHGVKRVIIPTAGIEQGGKHLPLNKHEIVIRHTAEKVAEQLGNTLVAPIMSYVPEEVHMAFPGTISLREETFEAVLRDTVESLQKHGFTHIYMMGDSGGNQAAQQKVAEELSKKFRYAKGVTIASLDHYYFYNGQYDWLKTQGFKDDEIGTHAAIRDTSEVMAINKFAVRGNQVCDGVWQDKSGTHGRATLATPGIGMKMLALKVEAAVKQVRALERQAK